MQSYPDPNTIPADGGGPNYYSQSAGQQQQQLPAMANADDLQGIAQLSRGITPMMNSQSGGDLGEGQDQRGNIQHQYHHVSPHQQPAHLQAGPGQMVPMAGQYGAAASPGGDARKRTKTSRACDECRRKKIKCDALDETGKPPCGNCKRVNLTCGFTRLPQKRGPSKGYVPYVLYVDFLCFLPFCPPSPRAGDC